MYIKIEYLVAAIISFCVGGAVGSLWVNVLRYADDVVLLAPSWYVSITAMQQLLDVFTEQIEFIDTICNVSKTVRVMFPPSKRSHNSCQLFSIVDT
jgi:hypothetical protein